MALLLPLFSKCQSSCVQTRHQTALVPCLTSSQPTILQAGGMWQHFSMLRCISLSVAGLWKPVLPFQSMHECGSARELTHDVVSLHSWIWELQGNVPFFSSASGQFCSAFYMAPEWDLCPVLPLENIPF